MVTRSSWGRREGPWAGLVPPDPGPTERAKRSQSAAHSTGHVLMAAGQALSSQLKPPYGSFPVRKWANCDISLPSGETDGQGEVAGQGVRVSHLAPGGRRGARGIRKWELTVFKWGETLRKGVFLGHAPPPRRIHGMVPPDSPGPILHVSFLW